MLTVTEAAAQAINALVTEHQMPEGSGLRISRQGQTSRSEGLSLSLAAAPADEDSVIESNGAKVFLPPNMVTILDDQELDVEHDGQEPTFVVNKRKSAPQQ